MTDTLPVEEVKVTHDVATLRLRDMERDPSLLARLLRTVRNIDIVDEKGTIIVSILPLSAE